jgi:hypothetical protein
MIHETTRNQADLDLSETSIEVFPQPSYKPMAAWSQLFACLLKIFSLDSFWHSYNSVVKPL